MPNITDLYASVPGTKVDWKIDWKEDAKADWKLDWDETPGDAPAVIIPRPTNTVLPAITGLAEVGESLVVSTGTWTDAGPFTFAWFADAVAISGEDSEELVLAEAQLGIVGALLRRLGAGHSDVGDGHGHQLLCVSLLLMTL